MKEKVMVMPVYWRQKVMLEIVRRMHTVSKTQLMKLLFLLKEEEKLDMKGSFYDFLPYKYGPFSFLAYKDLDYLERSNVVEYSNGEIQLMNADILNNLDLKKDIIEAISYIMTKYGNMNIDELVSYIYETYPWYAIKSRKVVSNKSMCKSAETEMQIFTIGYEGLTIDGFFNNLLKIGVKNIIDVRKNPISHKYGFSKSSLEDKCSNLGFNYYHVPDIGIESGIRNQIINKSILWEYYMEKIVPYNSDSIDLIAKISKEGPSVLLCFERKPEDCHRHLLAKIISNKTSLSVKNL